VRVKHQVLTVIVRAGGGAAEVPSEGIRGVHLGHPVFEVRKFGDTVLRVGV